MGPISLHLLAQAPLQAMSSNHSRRSRVGPPHDDSPPENRQRAVQKAVRYIPEELTPTWGERWSPAPPRRKSDKTSTNSEVPVLQFEHGLSEFKLELPPTVLTPNDHGPPIPPIVHSHVGRHTKRKNRRTRKHAPYLASSHPQSQSSSARASTEELELDTPASDPFQTPLETECVATGSVLYGGSIIPHIYPVSQLYDGQNQLIPMYNNYQHEVSASSLTQYDSQMSQALPYSAMGTTFPQPQFPPFAGGRWPENDPDVNQCYVEAMGRRTFLMQSSPSDPSTRLTHLNKPYTRPRDWVLHQKQAYNIDVQDEPFPYNTQP